MSDNRKYFYLKLKATFFDEDSTILLEKSPNGALYVLILLKMYCKSLKNNGFLMLDENIPYTPEMLAMILGGDVGTVMRAIEIFKHFGLVEHLPDGTFYMNDIELLIGTSSTEGERKKAARMKNKQLALSSGQMADICPPELELKKEIDLDIEKERESENDHPTPYGKYQNVLLSATQYADLQSELPQQHLFYIEKLSSYLESSGKTYKNHAATIMNWALADGKKGKQNQVNYTCAEGESL